MLLNHLMTFSWSHNGIKHAKLVLHNKNQSHDNSVEARDNN